LTRPPRTITDLLARAETSADTGLRVLGRDGTATWLAWPTVASRAQSAAEWLGEIGVGRGDRVALVFPTEPAFFDAFFGVLLAGAVPVPLYPPVRFGRLDEYRVRTAAMLRAVNARLLLTNRRAYHVLGEVTREARPPLGCRILPATDRTIGEPAGDPAIGPQTGGPTGDTSLGDLPASGGQHTTLHPAEADPNDLALVQFSSGTVSDAKPVALTHRALVAQVTVLNSFWPDTSDLRHTGVCWLPLYHDMGLIGCVLAALERAATLTLLPPEVFVARPAAWLQAISTYRASVSPAPNFAYSLALQRIRDDEMDGVDLSCWRVALCGAETVVPDVMRGFEQRFARWGLAPEAVTPVYGLSEAALAVTFSDPTRRFVSRRFDRRALVEEDVAREARDGREIVSLGRPIPGFAIRIVDDTRAVVPDGCLGLVECRGPSLMEGYLDNAEATGQALRDGWLVTGDVGFLCQGDLFLTGRRKDVLLIRGSNHSPEEVEQAVQPVEGVRAGCAVAVSWLPEGADGEHLLLLVEARRGVGSRRFEEIASACGRSVVAATGLTVDRVVVLAAGTLPRTSSGKLRRQDALKQYLKGTLKPPAPMTRLRLAGVFARSALAHLRARWSAS
jgi:acyl-CoA synthetase (AMP-forming)/AMP-acid ligase II